MYNLQRDSSNKRSGYMRRRQIRILLSAFILSILAYTGSLLIVPPAIVHAQTFVIGSDPVDGSTINQAPSVVRIYFNAPLSSLSSAHVYALPNGQQVEVNATPSRVSAANPRELDVPLKPATDLPKGSYEVAWAAVDNADGHTTYGLIGFNIGYSGLGLPGTPTLGPSTSNDLEDIRALSPTSLMGILWEWIILGGLTLWIGLLLIERLLSANMGRTLLLIERVQKQSYSLQWLFLAILLLSECVTLVLRDIDLNIALQQPLFNLNTLAGLIIATNYGLFWLARIVVLLIAMGLLYWSGRVKVPEPEPQPRKIAANTGPLRQYVTGELRAVTTASLPKERVKQEVGQVQHIPPYRYTWLPLLLAGIFLLMHVLSGESTQVLQPHISALVQDWLNLGAQGLWFGGLAYLGYVLLPILPTVEHDHHTEILSSLLRRLTPYLSIAIGVQLVSRLFLSEASISNVQQLITDDYGRTLLVQSGLLVILLICAIYTQFILQPRLMRQALLLPVVNAELPARRKRQTTLDQSRQTFKQMARIQTWLGAAVLLCSAFMAFFAPPIVFPNVNYNNAVATASHPTNSQTNEQTNNQTNSQVQTQTQKIGPFTVTLQLQPGQAGTNNKLILTINGPDGKLVTNATVQIDTNMQTMNMGTDHVTINGGHPTYIATFDPAAAFSMSGPWSVNVRIQQPGQAAVQGTFQVAIS
jgi:methionine-rich copper-binding protein CopC/putative copper export protein